VAAAAAAAVALALAEAAAAAVVVVVVRGGKFAFGATYFWEGGGSSVSSSSRTGGRTCTHPGVDKEGPRDGDALLLPSAQAHAPLANQRRVPIGEGLDEPAAPKKSFKRSKSAWCDDEETVRVGFTGCARYTR